MAAKNCLWSSRVLAELRRTGKLLPSPSGDQVQILIAVASTLSQCITRACYEGHACVKHDQRILKTSLTRMFWAVQRGNFVFSQSGNCVIPLSTGRNCAITFGRTEKNCAILSSVQRLGPVCIGMLEHKGETRGSQFESYKSSNFCERNLGLSPTFRSFILFLLPSFCTERESKQCHKVCSQTQNFGGRYSVRFVSDLLCSPLL